MQFLKSPGGKTFKSSLSLPELLPASVTVTIAVRLEVRCFKPSRTFGSPVPPPIATILGGFLADSISSSKGINSETFLILKSGCSNAFFGLSEENLPCKNCTVFIPKEFEILISEWILSPTETISSGFRLKWSIASRKKSSLDLSKSTS